MVHTEHTELIEEPIYKYLPLDKFETIWALKENVFFLLSDLFSTVSWGTVYLKGLGTANKKVFNHRQTREEFT